MVNHDGHLLLSEGDARGGWPIRVPGCVAKRLKHGGCFASLIISKASIGWKDLQRREMTPIAKKGVVLSVSVTFEIGGGRGGHNPNGDIFGSDRWFVLPSPDEIYFQGWTFSSSYSNAAGEKRRL